MNPEDVWDWASGDLGDALSDVAGGAADLAGDAAGAAGGFLQDHWWQILWSGPGGASAPAWTAPVTGILGMGWQGLAIIGAGVLAAGAFIGSLFGKAAAKVHPVTRTISRIRGRGKGRHATTVTTRYGSSGGSGGGLRGAVICLLVLMLIGVVTPQQLIDGGARIVPSAYCGPTPRGGIIAAAYTAGDSVRRVATWDGGAEDVHRAVNAVTEKAGEAWTVFRAAVEGDVEQPTEDLPPAQQIASECCTAPIAPATTHDKPLEAAAAALIAAGPMPHALRVELLATGGPESGYDPTADNPTSTAFGVWQLLAIHDGLYPDGRTADVADQAVAARALAMRDGMRPWFPTHGNGLHKPYVEAARAALATVSGVQGPQPITVLPAAVTPSAAPEECSDDYVLPAGHENSPHENGRIPLEDLCDVGPAYLRCDAAEAFTAMRAAYEREIGVELVLTDGYRDYAGQVRCRAEKGSMCAEPGTSLHGWGIAVDLGGGVQSFGTAQHLWVFRNGPRYGWHLPEWAQQSGSKPEPWHFEYVGTSTTT